MWLSNTATTAMMFPIAQAVLHELREGRRSMDKSSVVNNGTDFEMDDVANQNQDQNIAEKTGSDESIEKPDGAFVR